MVEENGAFIGNRNENENSGEEVDEQYEKVKQVQENKTEQSHQEIEQQIQVKEQPIRDKEQPTRSKEQQKVVIPQILPPKIAIKQEKVKPKGKPAKVKKDILTVNDVIREYTVVSKLAEGGYGQIYKAVDTKTKLEVAVKIELIMPSSDETESIVLQRIQGQPHCPILYTCGKTSTYMFTVMQLMGKNLSELRKSCSLVPPRLSISSTYRVTIQCLKGIEELHSTGFIHRDIKPSNFAIGKEIQGSYMVYLLDYGLCREYIATNGTVKPSRLIVGFRGTVRYASINAHARKDLSRRDDLLSLFYAFIEFLTGSIPWRMTNDKDAVFKLKNYYTPKVLCKHHPLQIKLFVDEIERLEFSDKPNYETMYQLIKEYLNQLSVNLSDPYDWHLLDCRTLIHSLH